MSQEGVRDTIVTQMHDLTKLLKGAITVSRGTTHSCFYLQLWYVITTNQNVLQRQ